ncbi:hypothetical protein [Chitinophaga arvensicola]|uniref:Uncharacterized protein n=1 Tax=Chitinophaga arvensicola TaxID=29529 RepID=A0A1I0Q3R1_9BACT|nr:hypothetical protein [Chitinophaga arvensicola]SEW21629.1 hypothetical protein SAMN04488122_1206 [Chitinophaga arvensicola]
MTTDEHALQIIAQLSTATDYQQADQLLLSVKKEQAVLYKEIFTSLLEKIELLSPLECNSLQWSMYRYTLMHVRKCITMEPAC